MNASKNTQLRELQSFWETAVESGADYSNLSDALKDFIQSKDEEKITELQERFIKEFGVESEMILVNPGRALGKTSNEYFSGLEYSLPLSQYMLRRAYGEDKDEGYEKFKIDVDRAHHNSEKENTKGYPTQFEIEKICSSSLVSLYNMRHSDPELNNVS